MSRNQRFVVLEVACAVAMLGIVVVEPKMLWVLFVIGVVALVLWLIIKALQWADRGSL